jgi:hypothetical protein
VNSGLARRVGVWAVLALVPFAAHLPLAAFGLSADPIYFLSGLAEGAPNSILPGLPGILDPNAGFTTEALGGLAAHDWLRGVVPWWNPYSGVGLPLAAEMQPAAFFLPFTLLLALPGGVLWLKLALQVLTGWATFGLLRQLGLLRRVALLGGVLYQLNGTFAWFAHAPINPVPFLPLLLLGIERSFARAQDGRRGGWGWAAVATAWSLYAGFPETAFIDGLLGATWGMLRLAMVAPVARLALARKLAAGAVLGVLLAAPIILPFLQFLRIAYVGHHAVLGAVALDPGAYAVLLAPYLYGPIGAGPPLFIAVGYVGLPLVLVALLALRRGRRQVALRWLLAGWVAAAIAKSAQLPGVAELFNLIPFLSQTPFCVYAPPSWELAIVVLACCALDDWHRAAVSARGYRAGVLVAGGVCGVLLGGAIWLALPSLAELRRVTGNWPVAPAVSLGWTVLVTGAVAALFALEGTARRGVMLGVILAGNAALLFALPLLAGTRPIAIDTDAVRFLRQNLGLSRLYTLGPLAPNYSALYGIAAINHNYLPVPRLWVDYIRTRLDPGADDVLFIGYFPPPAPGRESRVDALRQRLASYEAIGVKFVLATLGSTPFAPDETGGPATVPLVFHDSVMDVYQLPDPAPYFDVRGGDCTLSPDGRERVAAQCTAPATLIRRELFYPGWAAELNGEAAAVGLADNLFQAIRLPAGSSDVRFRYAPPHSGWAWGASVLGLACLLAGLARAAGQRIEPRAGEQNRADSSSAPAIRDRPM